MHLYYLPVQKINANRLEYLIKAYMRIEEYSRLN